MNCPECGMPCEPGISRCPLCGAPLGNASFTPVEQEPGKKRRHFLPVLCILLLLACAGFAGYRFYIRKVENECVKVTKKLMDCASTLDFSSFGKENLPSPLSENTDLKKVFSEKLDKLLEDTGIAGLLTTLGIEVDHDGVLECLMQRADYSITGVETTWNRCTVTVTTSNISIPDTAEQMESDLSSAAKDLISPGSWWDSIRKWFSSLLTGEEEEGKVPETFSGFLNEYLARRETNTVTGTIVYGIRNNRWTLISVDMDLLYNYYGFPQKTR